MVFSEGRAISTLVILWSFNPDLWKTQSTVVFQRRQVVYLH